MGYGKLIKEGPPGICDRCGAKYRLDELKYEVQDSVKTGYRVCPDCFDSDHPQYKVGRKTYNDPRNLKDPRPERDTE